MVAPCSEAMIPLIPLLLPDNQDFLFYPAIQTNLMLFMHLVDHQISKVLIRNISCQMLYISRRHKLGHLIDIVYENYFLANIYSAFNIVISPSLLQHLSNYNRSPFFLLTDSFQETILSNGVKIYKDATAIIQIAELVAEYPIIWESQGFVQICPEKQMIVLLKPDQESKILAIKPQIYLLGNKAWYVVDDTFNKMHKQGCL